ncbi:MAG: hotdog fold thioesterase [Saprospiraceae bacterium]
MAFDRNNRGAYELSAIQSFNPQSFNPQSFIHSTPPCMTPKEKAYQIAQKQMYDKDAFSKWLGIKIIDLDRGSALLEMIIRPEMTNGFDIAHGGITYALADSAFAFASNSTGRKSVSIETSISHTQALKVGDVIQAVAKQESETNKLGIYSVKVTKFDGTTVALFKGTVYRTSREWEV